MEKQELIKYLLSLESASYNNGKDIDQFHLGQILAQYIGNEVGNKSYQEFNNLLNDILTLKGCESLLSLYENDFFYEYIDLVTDFKDKYSEIRIINEFHSLVELIENQLIEVIENK